jgi:hypothetical protein
MSETELSDGVRSVLEDAATWEEPRGALEQEVVDAIARAARAEAPPETARRASRAARLVPGLAAAVILLFGLAAVLAWPGDGGRDTRAFALAGTARARDASARVSVEETGAGALILFDADGLAPAPPDTYYEGWVDAPSGDKVSIGTFHLHESDRPIALWAGVDLADYPVLTVIEPEDGDAGSSGNVVLRGSIGAG